MPSTPRGTLCTLQIPISDRDEPFARHILPHQMRVLGQFADDVLISINRQQKPADPAPLDELLLRMQHEYPQVRVLEVDYGEDALGWVSETFFSGAEFPLYDFKGIPIHAFLEQIRYAKHDYFMQLASDLMLGGSGPWLSQAIDHLASNPKTLVVNPLAGPPWEGPYHSGGRRLEGSEGMSYEVPAFSSRVFLVDVRKFVPAMAGLPRIKPSRFSDRIQTRIAGHEMVDHLEVMVREKMLQGGFTRVDMGGAGNLWTLHPVHKTAEFIDGLPGLISSVQAGEIPAEQHGRYDLHSSLLPLGDVPSRRKRLVTLGRTMTDRTKRRILLKR